MAKQERRAELLLGTTEGLAVPCSGASGLHTHPGLEAWVRRVLRAGEGLVGASPGPCP